MGVPPSPCNDGAPDRGSSPARSSGLAGGVWMFSCYLRPRDKKESIRLLVLADCESQMGPVIYHVSGHSFKRSVTRSDKGGSRPGHVLNAELPNGPGCQRLLPHCPPGDSCHRKLRCKDQPVYPEKEEEERNPVLLPPADQTSPWNLGPRVSVFSLPREWGGGCQVFGRIMSRSRWLKL